MKHVRVYLWLLSAAGLVALSGCGGTYDASATGHVTLDGNVVPRGMVMFQPVLPGPASYGLIDSDGAYTVTTGREEGLPSGEYDVCVIANEPPAVARTATGGAPPPGKPITPARYRTRQTSGLKYTIAPGSNTIDLKLTTQPSA